MHIPGYLSYSAEEGEVVCVFESEIEAEQLYTYWRARISGEGWDTVRPGTEELIKVDKGAAKLRPRLRQSAIGPGAPRRRRWRLVELLSVL